MEELKEEKGYIVQGERETNNPQRFIISLGETENGLLYIEVPVNSDDSLSTEEAVIIDITDRELPDEEIPEDELEEGVRWYRENFL